MCNLCVVRVTLPSVGVTLPGVDHGSNRGSSAVSLGKN